MNIPHFIFGVFGNAIGLFLFLAPVVTFKRVLKNKSTEQFSGIPYVMTLLNCLLAAWYGLPFVSPNNILVTIINGAGAVLETIYVLFFLVFAPKKEKLKVGSLFALVLSVFAAIVLVSILALHGNARKVFCGVAASVFSIIMYGSPLSIMRLVIKTRSVEYMPFFLSLFCFLCGTSWFIYGLLGQDPFVAVPNGFGCALGAIQLILYTIYYKKKPNDQKQTTTTQDVELGQASPKTNGLENEKAQQLTQDSKPNTGHPQTGHA